MCKRIGPHPVALLEAGKSFQGWLSGGASCHWMCTLSSSLLGSQLSIVMFSRHEALPHHSGSKHKARHVLSPPKLGAKGRTFWG